MAALFAGCTQRIYGDSQDYEGLVIFHNEVGSRVKVNIRRLMMQAEMTATTTSILTPSLTYRGSGTPSVQGGHYISKTPFDTSVTSDEHVKMWGAVTPDGSNDSGIVGTAGVLTWRQWASKLRSAAEQYLSYDNNQLPLLVANSSYNWSLYPGEYLIVRADPDIATDNNVNNGWIVNCVWEEVALSTFTISGVVTLSGVGVVGAEVTVIVADDTSLTNAYLHSIQVTTTGGAWSADIPNGKLAYAYASNYATGTYYTAPGRPFIT